MSDISIYPTKEGLIISVPTTADEIADGAFPPLCMDGCHGRTHAAKPGGNGGPWRTITRISFSVR